MIRLTYKGHRIFEAIRDYSPNELSALQSILYEEVTVENFQGITGLPQETLESLVNKDLVAIGG